MLPERRKILTQRAQRKKRGEHRGKKGEGSYNKVHFFLSVLFLPLCSLC
jgi:hypothetical protein